MSDLPKGYRWATAEECEDWPHVPGLIIVPLTVSENGHVYTQGESDLAVPIN